MKVKTGWVRGSGGRRGGKAGAMGEGWGEGKSNWQKGAIRSRPLQPPWREAVNQRQEQEVGRERGGKKGEILK